MKALYRRILRGIKPPANVKELDFFGDVNDIIQTVMFADKYSQEDTAEVANLLRGKNDYETAKNVWRFVVAVLTYVEDKAGHEKVRGPAYTFKKGTGDCKNFSIATSSLLKNLGIKHKFRFTGYQLGGSYEHVYIVAKIKGREVPIDTTLKYPTFDYEEPYSFKLDKMPRITYIRGVKQTNIRAAKTGKMPNWLKVGLAAIVAGITYKTISS